MTLFKWGKFISHSGIELDFKIECDALTDEDIECIAKYISSKVDFSMVRGIPCGGCRLATALEKYTIWKEPIKVLIVDDVLTTGTSMEKEKDSLLSQIDSNNIIGFVIFARTTPSDWINAMFTLLPEENKIIKEE